MSRVPFPTHIPDTAAFARALGRALKERHAQGLPLPGHVELLNLVARAVGLRNVQALKAAPLAEEDRELPPLTDAARRALGLFDTRDEDSALFDDMFKLLQADEIGMTLTESFAMQPAAAVSGFYFAHQDAKYFSVDKIGTDQLEDMAKRRHLAKDYLERWLAPNLG